MPCTGVGGVGDVTLCVTRCAVQLTTSLANTKFPSDTYRGGCVLQSDTIITIYKSHTYRYHENISDLLSTDKVKGQRKMSSRHFSLSHTTF